MPKKRKKISQLSALLLSLCIIVFSLSGCFRSRQLNERLLVQGIGIDWENNNFLLTFQIFAPAAEGGGSITATAQNAKTLQSSGSTVSIAIQNATLMQGKELFLGHSRILIIGRALAERGVEFPLTYFSSNASARHNVTLAVADGKAADILTTKINQGILPAETLEQILENGKENGQLESIQLFEFLASLENKHESAALPILKLEKQKAEEKTSTSAKPEDDKEKQEDKIENVSSVKGIGMAIFSNAKMTGELEGDTAQGLMFLRNSLKQTTIAVESEDYSTAAVHIYKAKSKLVPEYDSSNPPKIIFTLKLECEATIGEAMLKPNKNADFEATKRLQSKCEEYIKKECYEAFKIAITQKKSDIFNLGNIVWKDNAKLFKTMRNDWPQQLSKIKLVVEPVVVINRIGLKFNSQ